MSKKSSKATKGSQKQTVLEMEMGGNRKEDNERKTMCGDEERSNE